MRYKIAKTTRFKTAYKRIKGLKGFKKTVFVDVIEVLASGNKLDKKFKDHKLTGVLKDFRECHLAPDILLIYQIDGEVLVLTLVNVGNHSQLFK